MQILGLGTDIISVGRIKAAIARQGSPFLQRLFTPAECAYCQKFSASDRHFAGRFAAKEAILKAAGTGLDGKVSWHDIEILNDTAGRPIVRLTGALAMLLGSEVDVLLSISHCKEYATATAVLVRR